MPPHALAVVDTFLQDPRTLGGARPAMGEPPLLLAAVSGGADSMVLLDCLDQLRAKHRFRLGAVHVHHGLRGWDADQDAAFVKAECDNRGLPYYVVRGDTRHRMATSDLSVEEAARQVRYSAFADTARSAGARAVVVAHHLDDDVETLLMRLITGGSLQALAGMEPVAERFGVEVWRPFLRTSQAALVAHLRERGLKFRSDLSNLETGLLRNRIRLELLPRIKSDFNPQVVRTLGKLLGELKALRTADIPDPVATPAEGLPSVHPAELDARIEAEVLEEAAHVKGTPQEDQWQFPVVALQGLETRERWGLWKGVLRGLGVSPKYLTRELFEDLDTLISRTHGTLAIDLPGGRIARRTYGTLVIGPRLSPSPSAGEVVLPVRNWAWTDAYPGWVILAEQVRLEEAEPGATVLNPPPRWWEEALFQTVVAIDRSAAELRVRPRRSGDERALPTGGHRSLKEWFIDAKLPQLFRDRWPVVASAGGEVLWSPGLPHGPLEQDPGKQLVRLTAVKTAHWG